MKRLTGVNADYARIRQGIKSSCLHLTYEDSPLDSIPIQC